MLKKNVIVVLVVYAVGLDSLYLFVFNAVETKKLVVVMQLILVQIVDKY